MNAVPTPQRGMTDVRAAFSIAFALAALLMPHDTLRSLSLVWGAYAFCEGIVGTFTGAITRWWPALSAGLAMIAAGICAFLRPEVTGLDLMPVIAAWALLRASFDFSIASIARPRWPLIANGIISACFAPLFFSVHDDTAVSYMLASYALITGSLLFASGWKSGFVVTARRGPT